MQESTKKQRKNEKKVLGSWDMSTALKEVEKMQTHIYKHFDQMAEINACILLCCSFAWCSFNHGFDICAKLQTPVLCGTSVWQCEMYVSIRNQCFECSTATLKTELYACIPLENHEIQNLVSS